MARRLGRYEALKKVAKGGMATVYLGRALGEGGFQRLVAIKLMHEHYANEPEFEAMFLDEAMLAARIRHPNVVPTLDVQKTASGMYLVMEYVEGPTVLDIVRELHRAGMRLPPDITVRITIEFLAGLHAAHQLRGPDRRPLKLIHRDVSPQNILVGRDGTTRITDFGVARADVRLSSTETGKIKGKVAFMPPEQLSGHATDHRADVYSAAVVLWEMLTGERLFRADNTGLLLAQVLAGVQRAPSELNPEVPHQVDAVCLQALQIVPAQRYPTAAAFAEALERAAHDAGIGVADTRQVGAFIRKLAACRARIVPDHLLLQEPARDSGVDLERLPPELPSEPSAAGEQDPEPGETTVDGAAVLQRGSVSWPKAVMAGVIAALLAGGIGYALSRTRTEPAAAAPVGPSTAVPEPVEAPSGSDPHSPGPGDVDAAAGGAGPGHAQTGGAGGADASPGLSPTSAPTMGEGRLPVRPPSGWGKGKATPGNPDDYNPSVL